MRSRAISASMAAVLAVMAATDTNARAIRIDEGNPISDTNPSFWEPHSLDPTLGELPFLVSNIGFAPNFDQDTTALDSSRLTIYQNGYVSFGATQVDLGGGPLVSPVIAPFLLSSAADISVVQYATGRVDLSGPPYSDLDAVDAFRVSWFFDEGPALGTFPFQLVLLDMSTITGVAGDFDIELNYGYEFQDAAPTPYEFLIAAGFQLGAAGALLDPSPSADPNPFVPATNHVYQFRNGALVTGSQPPTSVSEPDTIALFGAGLIAIALLLRRRMRTKRSP